MVQVKQSPEDLVASCTELRDSLHRHECIASSAQVLAAQPVHTRRVVLLGLASAVLP